VVVILFWLLALTFAASVALYLVMPLVRAGASRISAGVGVGAFVVAGMTYLIVGSPHLVGVGPGSADAERGVPLSVMSQLETDAVLGPDDEEAWLRLAEARVAGGDYAGAAEAYQHLLARGAETEGLQSALGESLVFAHGGVVDNEARAAFEAALGVDDADLRARYYLAEADFQMGRADAAIATWAQLVEGAPSDAPWLTTLARRLTSALTSEGRSLESLGLSDVSLVALERAIQGGVRGPSPDQVDAVSALADNEQAEMIAGMVERLAARLEADPTDVEGWRMLARSYGVQGRVGDMAEAYAAVARLLPGDVDAAREHAYARLQALEPQTQLGAATLDALEVLLALDDKDPLARLVLGEQEYSSGDTERGRALLHALAGDDRVDDAVRARAAETLGEAFSSDGP